MTIDWAARLKSLTGEPSSDAGDDGPRRARVGRTRTEMMVQGEALDRTLAAEADAIDALAAKAAARGIRRIVVAGCGDSWFAGIGARLGMEAATGLPVEAAQAFDWAHYAAAVADPATLVIGLSSGGNTPAVMAAMDAAAARGAMAIGMSNTLGGPVLVRYDGGLVVHATRRGWPTQSSTAAIGLLLAFAAALGARTGGRDAAVAALRADLGRVGPMMDALAASADDDARRTAEAMAHARLILFTGAGPHFAAAAFGAAKVKELSPIHAVAFPLEEYHHYRAQKAGDPLFLVAPDAASRERALDTALVSEHVGGRTVALLPGPDPEIESRVGTSWRLPAVPPAVAPLLCSVPLHLFAYHFAEARFAADLGYPGAFPDR
jgi:glucosamine--fructose-6-phosphate aminotransferase (isomerizing)